MLAVTLGALGVLLAIGTVRIIKSRRSRLMDRAMRDYVRRAY